jgi:Putative restriction endonuclease
MTTLLIQSEQTPMTVNFPLIAQMTTEQFYEFCLANRDLRIERTATGDVIVMPPAFSETGNRNLKIAQQVANWTEKDGTGETFDSSAGFNYPMVQSSPQMHPGFAQSGGMPLPMNRKTPLHPSVPIL